MVKSIPKEINGFLLYDEIWNMCFRWKDNKCNEVKYQCHLANQIVPTNIHIKMFQIKNNCYSICNILVFLSIAQRTYITIQHLVTQLKIQSTSTAIISKIGRCAGFFCQHSTIKRLNEQYSHLGIGGCTILLCS